MSNLLLIILNDISVLPEILKIWRKIGVPGTTIIKSAGGHASRKWLDAVGLSAINNLFEAREVQTRTLMAVFEDEKMLAQAIAEAERIVGGFDRPDSGVVLVLPISQAIGIYKTAPKISEDISPPALRAEWSALRNTPIENIDALLELEPTIVTADTSLEDVAQAMLDHPNVHVASVVAEDGRLIGLLELSVLADDLFFHILPEEFLSETTDVDKMMAFADKTRTITAQDAMLPAVWVKQGETVKDAFKRMHSNKLPGLPLVDECYKVIGYVNLLELLSICIHEKNKLDSPEVQK